MTWRMLRPILIFPGTVLVVVPGILVWLAAGTTFSAQPARPGGLVFWLALAAGAVGLVLKVSTVALFVATGRGTPAPWDPPLNLVVRGPYRYVRNPMISGGVLFLLAESLMLRSWPVAAWMGFFSGRQSHLLPAQRGARTRAPVRQPLPPLQGQSAALDTEAHALGRTNP